MTLREQGQFTEAEVLSKRMVAIAEKIPGPGGPVLAHAIDQLAETYSDDGRYATAETYYQRSMVIWKRQLGETHPAIAAE